MRSPNTIKMVPTILAFEASTSHLSVAVYADGSVLAMQKIEASFNQAAELVPMALRALADARVEFASLGYVAAGCGPGSFTGLRVSLAAAKGICLAHDIPGLGISGLEALAFSSYEALNSRSVLCLADTRRGNVYAQVFSSDMKPQGKIFEGEIRQLPFLVPASICVDGLMLLGFGSLDAAAAFRASGLTAIALTGNGPEDAVFVDAGMVAKLAAVKIMHGNFPPLSPLYLAGPRLGSKTKQSVK